jgi:hypothetical protein
MKIPTLLTLLLLLALPVCAQNNKPPITPRSEWATTSPDLSKLTKQPEKIRLITIHQTETPDPANLTTKRERARLRSILSGHTTGSQNNPGRGWGDIAYHFIIGPTGTIYECRDTKYQSDSATVLPADLKGNITICMMGDFRNKTEKGRNPTPDQTPTPAALESLCKLIAAQLKVNQLDASALKAHRDLKMVKGGSDCPGGLLYPMIKSTILPKVTAKLAND